LRIFTDMKSNKNLIITFIVLVVVASLYRIIPRPVNFAPHIAMALFAGAVIRDKKWAFALPIFSMFLSDLLYQVLFNYGISDRAGFYEGQLQNYLLFAGMTAIGFLIKKINVLNVLAASIAAPTVFFILSNFLVWVGWQGTRGLNRPKTFNGLLMCYNDALPFYGNSVMACILFSAVFFGGYMLLKRNRPSGAIA
jgi:hypothetical protein